MHISDNSGILNRSTFKNGDDTVHDFRTCTARWGWSGLSLTHIYDRIHQMRGIGRGIKQEDIIITDYSGGGEIMAGYKVKSVNYHWNPKDLFDAELEGPFAIDESVSKIIKGSYKPN